METQKENRNYSHTALIITLLAGVGAVLSYPYWGLRSGKKLIDASLVNNYRIDWLGI